ncbi:MAG: transcriptional repressor [Propionibacteriaceae bacterium]|jgi:Fur family ferric uptake transcriptional regulator|nr:transcriptional repressor [Propionibacteriaceae bacterium]
MTAARTAGASRTTRQRTAISQYLAEAKDFRTAQQIFDHLRSLGHAVSLPTVYRTLTRLADAAEIDQLRLAGGETAYRHCATTAHHHHLVCRHCHTAVEVAGDAIEQWAQSVADQHGFTDVDHAIELYGLCQECARR